MSSWFDTKSFASLAKSALTQAQKQFDKALEAVADEEDSDADDTVTGLDPFGTTGWATRKPKMKKDLNEEAIVKAVHSSNRITSEEKSLEVVSSPTAEIVKPEINAVTSQIKANADAPVGPITIQVRSQKLENDDETPIVQATLSSNDESSTSSNQMGASNESVDTTVQAADLDFSMLEETKGQFFLSPDSKSSSPVCNSESSGSGGRSADVETGASSDIEIISAINSTPSEALNQDQSMLWESDALTNALRELSGEMSSSTAMENLLHAREQKVMTLSGDKARLLEENEKLQQRVAQLEARNLEFCRNSSEQVQQLLNEGDKLAKEVLEKSNAVKKLRAKEKEQDELVKKQSRNIDELNVQLDRLRKSIAQKNIQEESHIEQIRELKAAKITAADLKFQLDQSKARLAELESRNAKILMESKVMTASVELTAQDQMRSGIAELKARHSTEVENLRQKVVQLESSLRKAEAMISQNELHGKGLRQEVLSLQEKNQELTESLSMATAPYVRELEKMKAVYDSERKGFENEIVNLQRSVESLRQKASETEEKWLSAMNAKKTTEVENKELLTKIDDLQQRLEEAQRIQHPVKSDNSSQLKYIEMLKAQLVEREDAITNMNQTIELLRTKELSLQQKILNLEQSVDFERQKSRLESTEIRPASPAISNRSSLESDFERNENYSLFCGNINSPSVIDNMSSQLKLKDGQMQQLRVELSQLKKSRDTLSEQLTEMTVDLERYKTQESELLDVSEKYEALLQMYGELVEKTDELKLDLEEARNAYRVQIQDLTARLKRANV